MNNIVMFIIIATQSLIILLFIIRSLRFRNSHFTLKRLFDHVNIGYFRYRCSDGTIVDANKGFLNILQLEMTPADVRGKKASELFISLDEGLGLFDKIREKGVLRNYEFWLKTLKGSKRYLLYNAYVIRGGLNPGGVIEAFFEDVTEERVSYEKMKESEERYEKMFKNAGDMVIIYKMEDTIIEEVNPAAEMISGYRTPELIGRTFEMLFHPLRRNMLKESQDDLIFKGHARVETTMVCKSGVYREVILSLSTVDIKGEKMVMVLIKDISSIMEEREEQNKRKKELEDFWKASVEREERIKYLRDELERSKRQLNFLKDKYGKSKFK